MEKIKTALCSFGMSGWVFHAPFITAHPGFEFYAVWERTKNNAAEKYPSVKTYRTLEELLADEAIELVVVNTPSVTHYDYAKLALEAGKNVLVEKPFTATAAQAEELIALARARKVKLTVYQNRRWDSDFLTVKKVLSEGGIGDIVEAEIHYDRYTPELSPKAHKEQPTPGVGSLYDLGSHLLDQAVQLFGMPKSVSADIATNRPGSQVDDYFDVKLFYSSHRVTVKSSYYVREALPGYILHGTKGSFLKKRADVQETDLQAHKIPGSDGWGVEPETDRGFLHTEKDGKIIKENIPTEQGNYMRFYDGLQDALRNDGPVPVAAEDALNTIRLIEAAWQSQREKKVIEL